MAGPIVIDASLALAWVLDEPQPDWAHHLRAQAEGRLVDLRVPTAFWLEVDNILVRQPGTTHDQMLEGVLRLDALGLTDVELDRPMRLRSLELAFRHRLTTYDAVYLALAVDQGVQLATLDAQLARAASSHDLRYGDDHTVAVRERWPTYGADQTPDPVSLAAIGAYIARFREPLESDRDTRVVDVLRWGDVSALPSPDA